MGNFFNRKLTDAERAREESELREDASTPSYSEIEKIDQEI